MGNTLKRIGNLYVDGFRNMTWGKPLWILIILKIVILFGVLRVFFFKPDLADKTEAQKSEIIGERLSHPSPDSELSPSPEPGPKPNIETNNLNKYQQ